MLAPLSGFNEDEECCPLFFIEEVKGKIHKDLKGLGQGNESLGCGR